jgi:hypothetical protein
MMAPPPAPGHVFGQADGPARIELRFTGDCWMQVRGPGSDMGSGKLMHAGDVYRVPDRGGLSLRVGDTDKVAIVLDGKTVTLPPAPSKVQTIALDPARLAAGTAAALAHTASAAHESGSRHDSRDRNGRVDRAAAAAATAAIARRSLNPGLEPISELPPRERSPSRRRPMIAPPPGALDTPPPPPNQPPPPPEEDD